MSATTNGVTTSSMPFHAIAKYDFEGRNNDELTFFKNDIITVTQQLEGGWWEGSLRDEVGWFPSNFVGLVKTESEHDPSNLLVESDKAFETTRLKFRNEILSGTDGFLIKETKHISELLQLSTVFLPLILEKNVFNTQEVRSLAALFTEIIDVKKELVQQLQHAMTKDVVDQKIGAIFLDQAAVLQRFLYTYCFKHPEFVALIVQNRQKLENVLESENLKLKDFITGLSLVFRHTEKYASILQEVERNTANTHSDRGNLQRACSVFRDIAEECTAIRKQKETQLDFLKTDVLEKSVGKNYEQKLGTLVYIGSVTIQSAELKNEDAILDRYLTLFTNACLFYEVLLQKGNHVLKEQIPTAGVIVSKDEGARKTTLTKGSKILVTILSLTVDDHRRLVSAMQECPFAEIRTENTLNETETESVSYKVEKERTMSLSPTQQLDVGEMSQASKPQTVKKSAVLSYGDLRLNNHVEMILPEGLNEVRAQKPPPAPGSATNGGSGPTLRIQRNAKLYSGWCLRPYPPPRGGGGNVITSMSSSSIKMRKGLSIEEQEDAYLLKIVEGYCGPASTNGLSNSFSRINFSTISNSQLRRATSYPEDIRPTLIMAENEKLFVEEMEGEEVVVKEKSLVDTVYALKDQVTSLQKDITYMSKTLEKEQRARRRLEEALRRMSNQFSHSSTPKPTEVSEVAGN